MALTHGGWARVCVATFYLSIFAVAMPLGPAHAGDPLEARKSPMTFAWHPAQAGMCEPDCRDWVSAVGTITNDTPALFAEFAQGRDLAGVHIVLDSSGGSVLDTIAMGRVWRSLGVHTSVGIVDKDGAGERRRAIRPEAYCESMCVFLLLAGVSRDVPPQAHVRVHQIWMGDRATDAKAASYSAEDLMIVQHDVGSLAKYTFDMGGSGDLLALALSVPPWEPLYELSAAELRASHLTTDDRIAGAMTAPKAGLAVSAEAKSGPKPVQDRLVSEESGAAAPAGSTRTAAAQPPTGGSVPAASDR